MTTPSELRRAPRVSSEAANATLAAGDRVVELSMRSSADGPELVGSELSWTRRRQSDWITAVRPFVAVLVLAVVVLLLPATLSGEAKASLFAFGLAVVLWSMTKLPAAWTALASVVALIALGGAEQAALFDSLSSDVVWLMIGAFVLGGAVQVTGLAARLTSLVAGEQRTVSQVCWRVTLCCSHSASSSPRPRAGRPSCCRSTRASPRRSTTGGCRGRCPS